MNPWTLIGWTIVGVCAIPVALTFVATVVAVFGWAKKFTHRRIRYYKTRNTPPRTGQIWWQDGSHLSIRVADNGVICVSTGNCGWGESPADWKLRVRARKCYLIKDAK